MKRQSPVGTSRTLPYGSPLPCSLPVLRHLCGPEEWGGTLFRLAYDVPRILREVVRLGCLLGSEVTERRKERGRGVLAEGMCDGRGSRYTSPDEYP